MLNNAHVLYLNFLSNNYSPRYHLLAAYISEFSLLCGICNIEALQCELALSKITVMHSDNSVNFSM